MNIKSSILSLAIAACSYFSAGAVDLAYNWGAPQVVADHTVGSGLKYTKIIYPDKPLILWFVEIDLSNPYTKVEQVQSRHQVPDPLRWDVMTHYRENSRAGHRVKVAWNHDFFSYDPAVCIGLNISEGEVTWTKTGRSLLAITDDGKGEVFYPNLDAFVTTPDGTSVVIDYYNALVGAVYGDCVLYNRFNSKTLTEQGTYVSLTPIDPWIVNGNPIRCTVNSVGTTPVQTTSDGKAYTLFLRGAKQNALDGHIAPGDILTVTQRFGDGWGNKPDNILNAFHGYPSIVHDGVLHEGEFNNFENGREYEKSSRVMAGLSQDKTKLYIATTEMSSASIGVDCIELSAWLVEHGAWDVVNFDSGGSAAIVIDEKMLNLPGRGSVRPVQDAMLAVSLAPDDNNTHHLAFSLSSIKPNAISRTPLRVLAFNQYDNIIDNELAGCEFECIPSHIGFVDSDGIFHAGADAAQGQIIARKNGLEASLDVDIQPVTGITAKYTSLLVDNMPHIISGIAGMSQNGEVEVDAGALDWSVAPDGIVRIDDGVITGLSNGNATISGKFKDLSIDIDVTVEIAQPRQTIINCSETDKLAVSKTAGVKNMTFDSSVIPDGWNGGAGLKFDLASGRGTYIRMSPKVKLYSLPDSISLNTYDPDGIVQNISFALTDAAGQRITATIAPDENGYSHASFRTQGSEIEYYRYPLTLNTVTCYLANRSVPGARLAFGSLDAYYPGYTDAVNDIIADKHTDMHVDVNGETLTLAMPDDFDGHAIVNIYSMSGQRVDSQIIDTTDACGRADVDIKFLAKGIYFVSVQTNRRSASAKFVIR